MLCLTSRTKHYYFVKCPKSSFQFFSIFHFKDFEGCGYVRLALIPTCMDFQHDASVYSQSMLNHSKAVLELAILEHKNAPRTDGNSEGSRTLAWSHKQASPE